MTSRQERVLPSTTVFYLQLNVNVNSTMVVVLQSVPSRMITFCALVMMVLNSMLMEKHAILLQPVPCNRQQHPFQQQQ